MGAHIAVVGSINMDLVAQTPRLPRPGETVIGRDLRTVPGGKGANQAVAAARLGASVAMVGLLGQDVFAGQLRDNLAEAGVNLDHVHDDPDAASGVALIVVDDSGENSIVVASGANARLMPEHVEAAAESIREARVLLLQLEVPLATVRRAAEIARQGGARVILNPAPAQPLSDEMLALVDILIPNESETALLTGLPVDGLADAGAAASSLRASGIGAVILTLGERGALLSQDGETRLFPAFAVERVVDTTAAGDAFVGGLATAVARGKSLPEAVTWGNAAGALAVTQVGAQPSLPHLVQLEAVLQRANEAQRQGVLL